MIASALATPRWKPGGLKGVIYGLYLMAAIYIGAGLNHFLNPKFYLWVMPPYLPYPEALNMISGVAEIILGAALLWPATRPWAAWGVIALLIAITPVHINMLQEHATTFARYSLVLLWMRLPLQAALIYWAYLYTHGSSVEG